MLPVLRRDQIIAELQKARFISVSDLAQRIATSLSTVRRDLVEMEREGVVIRTHGGVGLKGGALPDEMTQSVRAQQNMRQKELIGQATARLIEGAESVILDAGTTTLAVARALNPSSRLRVVTDSVEIAWELRDREHITVILTGGIMRGNSYNLFGPLAEQALMGLHVQTCVMGCSGLSLEEGLTKHDIEAIAVRRRMVEVSRQLFVVADSSKLGRAGLASVTEVEGIDTLVTDAGIPPAFRAALEQRGVHVIIA